MVMHVSSLADPEILSPLIWKRLSSLGIPNNSNKGRPRLSSSSKRLSSTPGPSSGGGRCCKVLFGRPLKDLPRVFVSLSEDGSNNHETVDILVPKFLKSVCDFIRSRREKEGIFRLSGSEARQRLLRAEIENDVEKFYENSWKNCECVSVLDAASLLKQWLRELPESIIPEFYNDILSNCCSLTSPEDGEEAFLLTTCLLPEFSSSALTYLMRFLAFIAEDSGNNKMDARNLAIVLAPSIFPMEHPNIKKQPSLEAARNQLNAKTLIVEKLIRLASKICIIEGTLEEAYVNAGSVAAFTSQSEDNLDTEDVVGPSARRSRKKKKRRSGSLSRVLTATMKGIQKAISRSATPAAAAANNSATAAAATASSTSSSLVGSRTGLDVHSTPLPTFGLTPEFPSPRHIKAAVANKRKAANQETVLEELSPNSKYRKSALESTITPKVRGRSFSVKRFKRKKSAKDPSSMDGVGGGGGAGISSETHLVSFSPLPSKAHYIATPCTPEIIVDSGLNNANRDISDMDSTPMRVVVAEAMNLEPPDEAKAEQKKEEVEKKTTANRKSNAQVRRKNSKNSATSNGGGGGNVVRRKSSDMRSKKSPNERKIGIVRKRSQEMTRKQQQQQQQQKQSRNELNVSSRNGGGNVYPLKRGQPNSLNTGLAKPSPIRVETPGQRPRIKMSFRETPVSNKKRSPTPRKMEKNDSLASLKKDISCLIESSFGTQNGEDDYHHDDSFNTRGVKEIIQKLKSVEMSSTRSPLTRGQLRRQSSAFEFVRPMAVTGPSATGGVPNFFSTRRQSSAFEIGEKKGQEKQQKHIYDTFNRVATRESLRRKNSSVKDLIRKIESKKLLEKERKEAAAAAAAAAAATEALREEAEGGDEEQWVDAKEFFSNKTVGANSIEDDDASSVISTASAPLSEGGAVPNGCKRSSIIRIRNENRGNVSKSVETFTKPLQQQQQQQQQQTKAPPHVFSKPAIPPSNPRRLSARMGVVAVNPPITITAPNTTNLTSGRQTLTGIRTTTTVHKRMVTTPVKRTPSKLAPNKDVVKKQPTVAAAAAATAATRNNSDRRKEKKPIQQQQQHSNANNTRKTRRNNNDGRRHLTIGYVGERVSRSPLRERQNHTAATVQRSKSAAQTPSSNYKKNNRKRSKNAAETENNVVVQRSSSLKSQQGSLTPVPSTLRETIYDINTPRSEKGVRRNLSDRVMTPTKGGLRNEAVPFILKNTPRHQRRILSTPPVRKSPRLAKMY